MPQAAVARETRIYFTDNEDDKKWCTQASEKEWRAASHSYVAGVLIYRDGKLAEMDITSDGESGDWDVFDQYVVDGGGKPQKLVRTTETFAPQSSVIEETFKNENGRLRKTGAKVVKPDPDQHLKSLAQYWLPNPPAISNLAAFDFYPLLRDPVPTGKKVCRPYKR